MLKKTIEKLERKEKRKPPIPYTRKGTTKQDMLMRAAKQAKQNRFADCR